MQIASCAARALAATILTTTLLCGSAEQTAWWSGVVRDATGSPLSYVTVRVTPIPPGPDLTTSTGAAGEFAFESLPPGRYAITVEAAERPAVRARELTLAPGQHATAWLELMPGGEVALHDSAGRESSGGESLSSREVAGLPLNKRDFGQLLLLAAGTMTDANGTANFTQQFAVNGQRGTAAVFAMDGIDISDPEMGGATFSNLNVDAVQEIQSNSGLMPAEVGRGAAGFTNIITKSGQNQVHGSAFEFVRNAAFDARNFFDRQQAGDTRRIPPFARNEFGLTNGGPLVLPHLYDGRGRTWYFAQYQGFRQVLGTTQVIPVPTREEREGKDSTAYPGDTLLVPVAPAIQSVLAKYPLPNDPGGSYGARTYATSSKVTTVSDQFSLRIDHMAGKGRLFGRFSLNDVTGPATNPSQTVIDPGFGIRFFDRQRSAGFSYRRASSPRLSWDISAGYIRSTPSFPTPNHTQPALKFADGLYESFNSAGGSVIGAFGNLFQLSHNISYTRGNHALRIGAEVRVNRDTTLFGISPNGEYVFAGGSSYSPVGIRSLTGAHDIRVGDPLPDSLSAFLTATPFSFTTSVAPANFPQGAMIGESGVRREAFNVYAQDTWKLSPRWQLSYGLRYEVNSRIHEATKRTSGPDFVSDGPGGAPQIDLLVNPQPPYGRDLAGFAPRLGLDWRADAKTVLRAGAGITTRLQNLWQENMLTGGLPFVVYPYMTAARGAPLPFSSTAVKIDLPPVYTTSGELVFASGKSAAVPANTKMDVLRYEKDLAALSPDGQIRAMSIFGIGQGFKNGYIGTWTFGLERSFAEFKTSASYVGTAGVKLPAVDFPNSYGGADPEFAPYTLFDSAGRVTGGFGPVQILGSRSHSTYHGMQVGMQKDLGRAGLGFQASYTLSKSLDDTSAVIGGFVSASSGAVAQTAPQIPWNASADRGPSTFDTTHVFSLSLVQDLPLDRVQFLRPLGRPATSGWQLLNISTLASGQPFTVYSGIQQTGVGSSGTDRPDQVGQPVLSTSRRIREDYFGLGDANASLFYIPIDVPGGTGPNQGRFGTLGRDTFRGPAFHNFDFALIKDTHLGTRGNSELVTAQFRAEFFNVFNIVNLGLPANIVLGPGFGRISRTAGPSRQLQFSLKLLY